MKTTIDGFLAPNASNDYRRAREQLYDAERKLIQQVEQVAQQRRTLPPGPEVPDYEFIGVDGPVRLSQLFNPDREPYLAMYHMMYWADDDSFCPMCSGWIADRQRRDGERDASLGEQPAEHRAQLHRASRRVRDCDGHVHGDDDHVPGLKTKKRNVDRLLSAVGNQRHRTGEELK